MQAGLACVGGVLLCGLYACSSGDRPDEGVSLTSEQSASVAVAKLETEEPIDFSRHASVKVAPSARCTIHPQGASGDLTRTEFISAAEDGFVRFYSPPSTWGTQLTLECDTEGKSTRHSIDLSDRSNFDTQPLAANATVVGERAPLTSDLLDLPPGELLRRQYPPRPDAAAMPAQYAKWMDRVTHPYKVLASVAPIAALGRHAGAFYGRYSMNVPNPQTKPVWSGVVLNPGLVAPTIYTSYEADMTVPNSSCGGTLCNAAIWGGLGGFNDTSNGGLIQSGFWLQGSGHYCPQTSCGMTQRSPVLFVEYLPGGVLIVSWEALNYSQTDMIYALGWSCDANLNTTNTGAYACFWFENATTRTLSGIAVVPKPSNPTTVFNGKTAEFIVEKPNNRNLGNFITETVVGTSWELNGTAHTNATDDWAVFDMTSSNGLVVKSFFPQNGGASGPDLPPQPEIAFAWFGAR